MKYFPLIWAALRRKPTRAILTLVSVVIGFTLFGLTMGVNANFRQLAGGARLDRLYVSSRYAGALTLAQKERIARLEDVTRIGFFGSVAGYRQTPGNSIAVLMADPQMREVFPELGLSPQQWQALDLQRDGLVLSRALASRQQVKTGDDFPVIAAQPRADGSRTWHFTVAGIVDDISYFPAGFALGNYAYLDQARSQADRGKVGQFWLLVRDSSRAEETARAIDRLFANSALQTNSESEKSILDNLGGSDSAIALGTEGVAALGMLMIAFLTGNAIAQSVRERIGEFAILKTIGFSTRGIIAVVFAEAALPCLLGAGLGLASSKGLAVLLPRLVPAMAMFPVVMSGPVIALALLAALAVAFVSSALPALRIARLDVATALARHRA